MSRIAVSVLSVDSHGKPDFHSRCPLHGTELKDGTWRGKKSTRHLGQQIDFEGKRYDAWSCLDGGVRHVFTSTPMKNMPTPEQLPQWIIDQQYTAAVGMKASAARKAGA